MRKICTMEIFSPLMKLTHEKNVTKIQKLRIDSHQSSNKIKKFKYKTSNEHYLA